MKALSQVLQCLGMESVMTPSISKSMALADENLTFNLDTNSVIYLENVTILLNLFNGTLSAYQGELKIYDNIQNDIDEYEFFDEIR